MKLTYPIVLIPFRDGSGGYTVEIPDLPGCVTEGRDMAEALFMAQDAASGLGTHGTQRRQTNPDNQQPD